MAERGRRKARRQFFKAAGALAGVVFLGNLGCKRAEERRAGAARGPARAPARKVRPPRVAPVGTAPPVAQRSKVCLVRSARLVKNEFELREEVVCEVLERGICELLGEDEGKRAWLSLFSPEDAIGIKVNCLAGPRFCTHPDMVAGLVRCLANAGISPGNVVIWDRRDGELAHCGFEVRHAAEEGKPLCYGNDAPGAGFGKPTSSGIWRGRLSRILTEHTNALINCPVAKDHSIAGLTLALKNHYGTIDNPSQYHGKRVHRAIADVNAHPEIKRRTRLVVVDLVHGVCQGGPGGDERFAFCMEGFLMSCDPVAADAVGRKILDEQRKKMKLAPLGECGREPQHIALAAEQGLGNAAEANIEISEVVV